MVKIGDDIEIEADPAAIHSLKGKIQSIDSLVDPLTHSVRVRALIPNEQGLLKPGMFVNAFIRINPVESLAVEEEAIFYSRTKTFVFLDEGRGLFEPREVVLGTSADGIYAVKNGLEEGDRIITNGNFLVNSENCLKAALSKL